MWISSQMALISIVVFIQPFIPKILLLLLLLLLLVVLLSPYWQADIYESGKQLPRPASIKSKSSLTTGFQSTVLGPILSHVNTKHSAPSHFPLLVSRFNIIPHPGFLTRFKWVLCSLTLCGHCLCHRNNENATRVSKLIYACKWCPLCSISLHLPAVFGPSC